MGLPALADPSKTNIQTSYDEGTPPEQALAAAVVMRCLEDLNSSDELERFEAHEWALHEKGPWAESRRFWCELAGVDGDYLHAWFRQNLTAPERPERKWDYREVFDILPADKPFTYRSHAHLTPLHPSQFQTRIHFLIRAGLVTRLEKGLFCVTGCEDVARACIAREREEAARDMWNDD